MATFNKVFKDIYTETLKEEGFKYNSKYGYFFRIINNELIQYITYISLDSIKRGMKLRRYQICDVSISVLEYCDCFGVQQDFDIKDIKKEIKRR